MSYVNKIVKYCGECTNLLDVTPVLPIIEFLVTFMMFFLYVCRLFSDRLPFFLIFPFNMLSVRLAVSRCPFIRPHFLVQT